MYLIVYFVLLLFFVKFLLSQESPFAVPSMDHYGNCTGSQWPIQLTTGQAIVAKCRDNLATIWRFLYTVHHLISPPVNSSRSFKGGKAIEARDVAEMPARSVLIQSVAIHRRSGSTWTSRPDLRAAGAGTTAAIPCDTTVNIEHGTV